MVAVEGVRTAVVVVGRVEVGSLQENLLDRYDG